MSFSKSSEMTIVELAVRLNVSVRRIHEIAKELGHEMKADARTIDPKIAKQIEQKIDDEFALIEEEPKKVKKADKTTKITKKTKVVKPAVSVEEIEVSTVKQIPKEEKSKIDTDLKKVEIKESFKSKASVNFDVVLPKIQPRENISFNKSKLDKFKQKEVSKQSNKPIVEKNNKEEDNKKKESFTAKAKEFSFDNIKFEKKEKVKVSKIKSEVADELLGLNDDAEPKDVAEIYDEIIAQEREREIIQTQRKKISQKDLHGLKQKKTLDVKAQRAYDPNRVVEIGDSISVKEFSEKCGISAAKIIGVLMKNGVLANINQLIDFDTVSIISTDLNVKIKRKRSVGSAEELLEGNLESLLRTDDDNDKEERAPIVVVMGHVDHGKTSLLDSIRKTNIVAKESGGITQHIGAYQVEHNGKKITFLDTPGHEAFTAMRARGAKITDIAILVVAADEGIKPQTLEALQHAKDAGVPIIVAINKIDKPGAEIDKIKAELAGHDLTPEEWGGTTIMVPVSAKTRQGIDQLLEMVLIVAELENLKANANREAVATVIEANRDPNLGPVATVIVNTGTLQIMNSAVIGSTFAKIKVMRDHHGKPIRKAGPSMPVFIAGIEEVPSAGDILHVVKDEKTARDQSEKIQLLKGEKVGGGSSVANIVTQINTGKLKTLKVILKADVLGTLEALKHSIAQIRHEDVGIKIILSGVGAINESDVMMASASNAIVLGFKVSTTPNVATVAEREKVDIKSYDVIYKLIDDIKLILSGLLEPEIVEVTIGKARILKVFLTERNEMIVGLRVLNGVIQSKTRVKVFRGEEEIGKGNVVTLKKGQDTVDEVKEGNECGIRYSGVVNLQEDDVLEIVKTEKREKKL